MKALSIMQPYAWLIVNGHKDIENRDWKPTNPGLRFRGRVLIHTGKRPDHGLRDPDDWGWPRIARPERFELGGIVGAATVVDCVAESASPWFFGRYGLVIRDARPIPFVPCLGQLGFFNVPSDVAAAVHALAETAP